MLSRFESGQCTDEELKQVMDWLHSPDSEKYFTNRLKESWDTMSKGNLDKDWSSEKIVEKSVQNIFQGRVQRFDDAPRYRHERHFIWRPVFWKIAALVLLLLSVGFYFYLNKYEEAEIPQNTVAIVQKENPNGQKSKIFLPDGSVIWLNADSRINYPEKFNDSIRLVNLEGEAYFEVAKDAQRPFMVHTDKADVTVLGTGFDVNAYPENKEVSVALVHGRVRVGQSYSNGQNNVLLEPGEGVVVSPTSKELKKFKFSPLQYTAWKDGILHFDKAGTQNCGGTAGALVWGQH